MILINATGAIYLYNQKLRWVLKALVIGPVMRIAMESGPLQRTVLGGKCLNPLITV